MQRLYYRGRSIIEMGKSKYDRHVKPRRRKRVRNAIEEFDAEARAGGMTYAQAQVKETCKLYQKRFVVPAHYRKAGKRGSRVWSPF